MIYRRRRRFCCCLFMFHYCKFVKNGSSHFVVLRAPFRRRLPRFVFFDTVVVVSNLLKKSSWIRIPLSISCTGFLFSRIYFAPSSICSSVVFSCRRRVDLFCLFAWRRWWWWWCCLNFAFVYIKMLLLNGVNSSTSIQASMCARTQSRPIRPNIFLLLFFPPSLTRCAYWKYFKQNDDLPSILHCLPSFRSFFRVFFLLLLSAVHTHTHNFNKICCCLFAWSHLRAIRGTASQFFRVLCAHKYAYAHNHFRSVRQSASQQIQYAPNGIDVLFTAFCRCCHWFLFLFLYPVSSAAFKYQHTRALTFTLVRQCLRSKRHHVHCTDTAGSNRICDD